MAEDPAGEVAVLPLPYESVVQAIGRGQRAPVYLLAGEDHWQQRVVLDALRAGVPEIGQHTMDGAVATPDDVVAALVTRGFVPGRLVVVRDAPWVAAPRRGATDEAAADQDKTQGAKGRATPEQALITYLDHPVDQATLVLCSPSDADRRRRLTRKVVAAGVALATVAPREPAAWLRDRCRALQLNLPPQLAARLGERLAGATCGRMDAELRKLAAYGPGLDGAALDALVPAEVEERLYGLMDAVLAGQVGPALAIARQLLGQGEPAARVLYAVGSQLRTIVAVGEACRRGGRVEAVAGELGLHPFVARKALEQSRRLDAERLLAAAVPVWEAERGWKSGMLEEAAAVDHALLGVLEAMGHLPAAGRHHAAAETFAARSGA